MKRFPSKTLARPNHRPIILNVRVSAEEQIHCQTSAEAAGQKVSEWVRCQILPPDLADLKRPRPRARPLAGEPILRELVLIRNLLVQTAASEYRDGDPACAQLKERLAKINGELERIGLETQRCTSNF